MVEKYERVSLDYTILELIKNGIVKTQDIFKQLPKSSSVKIIERMNVMEKQGLLVPEKNQSWWKRNMNPSINLTEKGKIEINKKHS